MFKRNDYVKIKDTVGVGKVIKKRENDMYLILLNDKKVLIHESNIEKADKNYIKEKNVAYVNKYIIEKNSDFIPELMIRHQVLEEAMFNLEIFVNDAVVNNVKEIKIIHGKNGGILRKAVHEYLKSNKNIASFRLGNYFEGSYGVTIAKLK